VIIDCNVSFGHWPFARFAQDTPTRLAAHLAREGIRCALVSSADANLFPEPEACNTQLRRLLRPFPNLLSVPVATPRVSSWRTILATPGIRAVKLVPNYHNYSLRDSRARALCQEAAQRKLPLLVQMRFEDERSHYELMKVPGVPVGEIEALASALGGLTIVALGAYLAEAAELAAVPNVYVDISFAETLDTLARLSAKVPIQKILFGSHTPLHYTRSAVAKLACTALGAQDREEVAWKNAARIFGIEVKGEEQGAP
jgi:hypothetical protein